MESEKFKHEYDHFLFCPDIHFGKHNVFGKHLAIGQGNNSIHIYPTKIYVGGKHGHSFLLSPEHMLIVERILNRFEQLSAHKKPLEHLSTIQSKTESTKVNHGDT